MSVQEWELASFSIAECGSSPNVNLTGLQPLAQLSGENEAGSAQRVH